MVFIAQSCSWGQTENIGTSVCYYLRIALPKWVKLNVVWIYRRLYLHRVISAWIVLAIVRRVCTIGMVFWIDQMSDSLHSDRGEIAEGAIGEHPGRLPAVWLMMSGWHARNQLAKTNPKTQVYITRVWFNCRFKGTRCLGSLELVLGKRL